MIRTLSASVGAKGGVNRNNDVITVQELLNGVSPDQGGPTPPLAVDGLCGPLTKKAIQSFQLQQFGWSGADGRVDPGHQTIARLNELSTAGAGIQPPFNLARENYTAFRDFSCTTLVNKGKS